MVLPSTADRREPRRRRPGKRSHPGGPPRRRRHDGPTQPGYRELLRRESVDSNQRRFDDRRFLLGKYRVAEITLARVARERHDGLSLRVRPRRDLQRRPDVRAGRDADQHAFVARQAARGRNRVGVRDSYHFVVDLGVEHLRYEPRARALNLMRSWLAAGEHRGRIRFDRDHLYARFARLQHLADAGDGASRTNRRDDGIDRTVGIAPNFFGGRTAMDLGIRRIFELLWHEILAGSTGENLIGAP